MNEKNEELIIRPSREEDIPTMLEIYAYARGQMRKNGNPTQWPDGCFTAEMLKNDIKNGTGFVIECGGKVRATFMSFSGDDPTYSYIENGAWKYNEPYTVIHRIASDGSIHDVVKIAVENAIKRTGRNIRMDTHNDNKIMQKILTRLGFEYAGVIYIADGSPRLAYELKTDKA